MKGSDCAPGYTDGAPGTRRSEVIEAVQESGPREAKPARAVVRGGEVHRIRPEQTEEAPPPRRVFDVRLVLITCFLLCAAVAAAIGIGSWIELSPGAWSGVAVGLSAAAGLLALLPRIDVRAAVARVVRLTMLLAALAGALATGYWVGWAPLEPIAAASALCAPTLISALLWPQQWSVVLLTTAMVAVGAGPSLLAVGTLPLSHVGAATVVTSLMVGALYGSRARHTPAARPAPQADTAAPGRRAPAAVLDLARSFASHEQGEIAQTIVNDTARTLGACGAMLLLWDESVEAFRVGAATGGGPVDLSELRELELTPDWITRLRKGTGKLVTPLAFSAIREPVLLSLVRRWQARSLYAVPFYRGSQVVGVLIVARSKGRSAFSEADNDILTGMAPHAAAALAHGRLIADLQSANALKEEFMATMSHELRTPLNVIIGYTDMQLEGAFGDLDGEHSSTLQTVREQAIQLLELIQATLDMSRLERGIVSLDPTDVDVRQMLIDLQKRIPPSWRKSTVDLEWKIEEDLPSLITDASKLQILLRNLIHNAMKFTNNGLVLVSASRHPSKPYVTFLVQDSGVGIKAEHLSQIFEMFRQAPDGESHAGGVGLGLYIVKRLAAALAAEIEVSSAPGRGASFRIHVPLPGAAPTTAA